ITSAPTTFFVVDRDTLWHTGTRLPRGESDLLRHHLGPRDWCLLQVLHQHRLLSSRHLEDLFFPSRRAAQMRLRYLAHDRRLLCHWRQVEPRGRGWRRHPSIFLLSQRGAAVLAQYLDVDPKPILQR